MSPEDKAQLFADDVINLVMQERDTILEEISKLKNDKVFLRPRKWDSTGTLIKSSNNRPKS